MASLINSTRHLKNKHFNYSQTLQKKKKRKTLHYMLILIQNLTKIGGKKIISQILHLKIQTRAGLGGACL